MRFAGTFTAAPVFGFRPMRLLLAALLSRPFRRALCLPCRDSLASAFAALLGSHGLQGTLSADQSTLATHLTHDG
jgi:hypothetical protein